jgi:hypothetical protein
MFKKPILRILFGGIFKTPGCQLEISVLLFTAAAGNF